MNQAALAKEGYVIYMSVKKQAYLNLKVNNWAV